MNFLGHLYLASLHQHSLLGSILPDLCKPHEWKTLSSEIVSGCHMHQQVDRLTDAHPDFIDLKAQFRVPRRRFAGIILDVSLDHYLAANWSQWHDQSLRSFVDQCYNRLQRDAALLPEPQQRVIRHMVQHDWLHQYREVSGIAVAFQGLSRRFRFENPLAGAEEEWLRHAETWSPAFENILSDIRVYDFTQ